jgi:hypothetical protein
MCLVSRLFFFLALLRALLFSFFSFWNDGAYRMFFS